MKSVVELRKWIANQLGQIDGNNDVEYVLRFIRRNTDHPCYTNDPAFLTNWHKFLQGLNCREIMCKK